MPAAIATESKGRAFLTIAIFENVHREAILETACAMCQVIMIKFHKLPIVDLIHGDEFETK